MFCLWWTRATFGSGAYPGVPIPEYVYLPILMSEEADVGGEPPCLRTPAEMESAFQNKRWRLACRSHEEAWGLLRRRPPCLSAAAEHRRPSPLPGVSARGWSLGRPQEKAHPAGSRLRAHPRAPLGSRGAGRPGLGCGARDGQPPSLLSPCVCVCVCWRSRIKRMLLFFCLLMTQEGGGPRRLPARCISLCPGRAQAPTPP